MKAFEHFNTPIPRSNITILPQVLSIRDTRCVLTVVILAIDSAGTLAQHERQEQEGSSAPR